MIRQLYRNHTLAGRRLTKCGSDVYQPNQPINLCYDTLGPSAAFMRGLFEYLYRLDGLALVPHMPPAITELERCDPVRFGNKRILVSTIGWGRSRRSGSVGANGSSSTAYSRIFTLRNQTLLW